MTSPLRAVRDRVVEGRILERAVDRESRRLNFMGKYEFIDRSRGSDRLAYVLAGYKPHLWDVTLTRFERFLPPDADVCIVSPAVRKPELLELCERRGWSFLTTAANYVSLAQNLAIRAHPGARWIYKFDEDMVISHGYCDALLDGYRAVEAEARYWIGFVAPTINLNGFSYVSFLEQLDLVDAYRERFGAPVHAAGQIPATNDGEAARWIWHNSLPFDAVAARFAERPFGYSTVPHKFNIGAILFERSFWERVGGFRVRPPAGAIGVDETALCTACMQLSHAMVVVDNVLAGHFAFGPQDAAMRDALDELRPGLLLADEARAADPH